MVMRPTDEACRNAVENAYGPTNTVYCVKAIAGLCSFLVRNPAMSKSTSTLTIVGKLQGFDDSQHFVDEHILVLFVHLLISSTA
jgi:hypothetical protein